MISTTCGKRAIAVAAAFVLATIGASGFAQNAKSESSGASSPTSSSGAKDPLHLKAESKPYLASDTMQQVTEATQVVKRIWFVTPSPLSITPS